MGKKNRKRGEKKRHLKYGNITLATGKSSVKEDKGVAPETPIKGKGQSAFKKELRYNLLFAGSFLVILLALYFTLTKTNILNPILGILGLGDLYN